MTAPDERNDDEAAAAAPPKLINHAPPRRAKLKPLPAAAGTAAAGNSGAAGAAAAVAPLRRTTLRPRAAAPPGAPSAKRPKLAPRSGRAAEELRVEACPGCAAFSAAMMGSLAQAAILHLLYSRGQIPAVWSLLLQGRTASPVAATPAAAAAPDRRHVQQLPLAQRKGGKYIDAVEATLAAMIHTVNSSGGSTPPPAAGQRRRRHRVVLVFGASPIQPIELYELSFPTTTTAAAAAVPSGAAAAADSGAAAAERKVANKISRQLLRSLVMDVQPRGKILRPTKLWLLVELLPNDTLADTSDSMSMGTGIACSKQPAGPAAARAGGVIGSGFAVKQNVNLDLLRRRAKTVHCTITLGDDIEDEDQAAEEEEEEAGGDGGPEVHNDIEGEAIRGGGEMAAPAVWAQSVAPLGALSSNDWNAWAALIN